MTLSDVRSAWPPGQLMTTLVYTVARGPHWVLECRLLHRDLFLPRVVSDILIVRYNQIVVFLIYICSFFRN